LRRRGGRGGEASTEALIHFFFAFSLSWRRGRQRVRSGGFENELFTFSRNKKTTINKLNKQIFIVYQ